MNIDTLHRLFTDLWIIFDYSLKINRFHIYHNISFLFQLYAHKLVFCMDNNLKTSHHHVVF